MGYESKFYIVNKTTLKSLDGKKYWAEVLAMFDLCKVPVVYDQICKYPKTNVYIYADDGNTEINEDAYGDDMIEIPIADMVDIMDKVIHNEDYYRRYYPFLGLLKGFNPNEWNDLVVLHYGH